MKDRFRALAVLAAVFLVGIIIGTSGSYYWLKPSTEPPRTFDNEPPPPKERMARPPFPELNLTEEQKKQFGEIMAETRKKFEEIEKLQRVQMVDLDQKRNVILTEHNHKVDSILTDDQKVKFDNFVKEWNEWLEKAPRRTRSDPTREPRRKPPVDSRPERIR